MQSTDASIRRPMRAFLCATAIAAAAMGWTDAGAVAPVPTPESESADATCADGSNADQLDCLSHLQTRLDADLDRTYQAALARLPEQDAQDRRRGRQQLRRSERAWLAYTTENCALVGGLQGGSNSWITHFAVDCRIAATKDRIGFLRKVAAGASIP